MADVNTKPMIGAKLALTDIAGKIVSFLEKYDPAFGYIEGATGWENKEQCIDAVTEQLSQGPADSYIAGLHKLSEQTPEAKEEADTIILEIMNYEGRLPNLKQMPVSEVATLDFVNNPDRQGTGGLNRDSRMFKAMLLHTREQEQTKLYSRYDEAFTAANLKDDFQPKIAILQLREGEENQIYRRFTSLETLDRILHEQPDCKNYELVYLRNAEAKTETEQERKRLNNQLYAEFNADTLKPRDYYGHSLSVGDVIVMTIDFSEQHAYYVDDIGFTKLPDDFLSREMSAKIRNDLDIRQEGALYETIRQFESENTLSIMDKTAIDRYFQITSEYSRIFELADRRGAIMGDTIFIDGQECVKTDEWKSGDDVYMLGNSVEDSDFFYAEVNGNTHFEYDHKPDRAEIEDDYIDIEAVRDIYRHEAEVFSHFEESDDFPDIELFNMVQALGQAGNTELVNWFGDMAVYEIGENVSPAQILDAYRL